MAYGLIPTKSGNGGVGAARTNELSNKYTIAAGYATALYPGDPVYKVADGSIAAATATTGALLGVFAGCQYRTASGEVIYGPWNASATTNMDIRAEVYDGRYNVYTIEADQVGTALTATTEGELTNLLTSADGAGGNATTKQSIQALDTSTLSASADTQFRVLGSAEIDEGYTAAGTAMDVYVMINQHQYDTAVAGV
jgi:hypothetical protein